MENIKEKAPDLFSRHGLDDDSFIDKYILPELNAMEVKAQLHEGEWRYSEPLVAHGPRTATNRLVAEMKGMLVKEQDTPNSGVRVIIINQAHRPPRQQITVPRLPAQP